MPSEEPLSEQPTFDVSGYDYPLDVAEPLPSSDSSSETVELYRVVSYVPLSIVLLALSQLLLVIFGPASLVFVVVLSVIASATALVGLTRRSQVEPEEDGEVDDEDSDFDET